MGFGLGGYYGQGQCAITETEDVLFGVELGEKENVLIMNIRKNK